MKRLTYTKAADLAQLYDELMAARPELRGNSQAEGTGDTVTLTVPDATDPAQIASVVAAHVPAAPPAAQAPTPAQIRAVRDFLVGANPATLAELVTIVRALAVLVRHRTGRV